jgi:hypothetical protein
MSPNMLLVTMPSNCPGSFTICMQSASTKRLEASMPGYSAATSVKVRCQRSPTKRITLDLSAITTLRRPRAAANSKA